MSTVGSNRAAFLSIGTLMAPFIRDVLGGSARAYGVVNEPA